MAAEVIISDRVRKVEWHGNFEKQDFMNATLACFGFDSDFIEYTSTNGFYNIYEVKNGIEITTDDTLVRCGANGQYVISLDTTLAVLVEHAPHVVALDIDMPWSSCLEKMLFAANVNLDNINVEFLEDHRWKEVVSLKVIRCDGPTGTLSEIDVASTEQLEMWDQIEIHLRAVSVSSVQFSDAICDASLPKPPNALRKLPKSCDELVALLVAR